MPTTRFIDIPGVRIAGDLAGQGSDLVFLHGGLLDRRSGTLGFHSLRPTTAPSVTTCEVQVKARPRPLPSLLLIMRIYATF
jgi:hypothetical protein